MHIKEGFYTLPQKTQNGFDASMNVKFDHAQRILIYDTALHYLKPKPSLIRSIVASISAITTFQSGLIWQLSPAYWGSLGALSTLIWMSIFQDQLECKHAIAQIHLLENDKVRDFSSEVMITKANGEEVVAKIKDLLIEESDDAQAKVLVENKRLFFRVGSAEVIPYLHPDLLYAVLNPYAHGVFIS